MSDDSVAALLDSNEPLVAIEAPAGCGKTYQGANFAHRAASKLANGRVLILTHTHAACGVFTKETRRVGSRVEIRTIDSLIVQIATAYHKPLGFPPNPGAWALRQGQDGFSALACSVASLLGHRPMIGVALAERYPIIIGDEHQDSSADQHEIIMALHRGGAHLRVFGDPMQRIYGGKTQAAIVADGARWEEVRRNGAHDELDTPHRWSSGSPELGEWILEARRVLKEGGQIDLRGVRVNGLRVLFAENTSRSNAGYRQNKNDRRPMDDVVNSANKMLVLSSHNETVKALRAFWNRRFPIWEGHTRDALGELVIALTGGDGNASAIAQAVVSFLGTATTGFTPSRHGNRFLQEVNQGCSTAAKGMPATLQELARFVLEEPNHIGAAKCLGHLAKLRNEGANGFDQIEIDHRSELRDAVRLGQFADPDEAMREMHRRRTFARPMPPDKAISTIHKAKGLECDHAIIIPCDRQRFSGSHYSRCQFYVALSRARRSLTLVVSRSDPSPLFEL